MKCNIIFFFLFFAVIASCGDTRFKKVENKEEKSAINPISTTIFNLEPALAKTDNMQVLYYDNPDGDALRYTRYFTYTATKDSGMIKKLVSEFDKTYVEELQPRSCRSEGKIYLRRGEDVLKTIYFSARGDSCSYFYLIKDGVFYYLPLSDSAKNFLNTQRRSAVKP